MSRCLVALFLLLAFLLDACGSNFVALPGTSPNNGGNTASPPPTASSSVPANTVFPKGFLWGVATAGHQSEGFDNNSNWTRWELAGRTLQIAGRAADFYHRYGADFDLAKDIGLNAFRLSVEWARIEPLPGFIDPEALEHYRRVIAAARARNLEPLVTLHHFTYPAWLDTYKQPTSSSPGWEDPYTALAFARYARVVAQALRGNVKYYLTINEPNTQALVGYLAGVFPPGKHHPGVMATVMKNFAKGHVLAYDAIHEVDPNAQVSTNVFHFIHAVDPTKKFPGDLAEEYLDTLFSWQDKYDAPLGTLPTRGVRKLDYIAFDYYFAYRWNNLLRVAMQWEWPVVPSGLYISLMYYQNRYHLPIMITENGLATEDGKPRRDGWTREAFLANHIWQVRRAIQEGAKVTGYLHWSLTDNYEWGSFKPRFGLYQIDYTKPDLPRLATPALAIYRQIVQANDVPKSLMARYIGR
ncbi:MAG: glycoside hydrolase family 1 protein [Cyanobacteria bacterium NC_groundwater_1444_Ag_S-0.65um_54_12]|nr:glycoside hydrolase family 1 protein [Cyanobacteria bacterium NC_groundwater_1444_Ag_S-0.65um_54_12]